MRGGRGRAARLWRVAWDLARRHAPRSPVVAVAVLVGLMAAVTVLRWFVDGAGQAAALLYVVPIALSALRFGRRGGAGAAGCAIGAFVVLELVRAGPGGRRRDRMGGAAAGDGADGRPRRPSERVRRSP